MNKILIISIGVVLCLGIGMVVVFAILTKSLGTPTPVGTTPSNQNTGSTGVVATVPSGSTGTQQPTVSLPTADGAEIQAKDIKKDTVVGKYPTPGYYYIGFHAPVSGVVDPTATENPPYLILYIEASHYFNIELLEEPIADTRVAAEQYLLQHLGITESDMCRLSYMVSVPNRINTIYAGQNLGFSFCIGAVAL